MALLTPAEYKLVPQGQVPSKARKCDACGKLIKSSYHFVVGNKDADTTECRDAILKGSVDKKGQGGVHMKKDNKKADGKEQKKSKKQDPEVEPEEDDDETESDDDADPSDEDEGGEVVDEQSDDDAPADEEDEDEDDKKKSKSKTAKKSTKKDEESDDDDEEEKPKGKGKDAKKGKKDEEEDDEEEDPKSKKTSKPDPKKKDKDDEKPKRKTQVKYKTVGGKQIRTEPYKYRPGTVLAKLFARISDGKWHVKQELFKGLKGVDVPFKRLRGHAERFGWDWKEKGDQVRVIIPKDVIAMQKAD